MPDDLNDRLDRHEAILASLARMLEAQHGFNERQLGFNERMTGAIERLDITTARIETLLARMLRHEDNGHDG